MDSIETLPYRFDSAGLRKTMLRQNIRHLWWAMLIYIGCGIFLTLSAKTALIVVGVISIVAGILIPIARVYSTMLRTKNSPIFQKQFVAVFEPSRIVQSGDGNIMSRFDYSDLVKVEKAPWGLMLFISKIQWLFIPSEAFKSKDEFELAYRRSSHKA